MGRYKLYFLAFIGATTSALGEYLCLKCARSWDLAPTYPKILLVVASILWALCGPVWFLMLRSSQYATSLVVWDVLTILYTVGIALVSRESVSSTQWIGVLIVIFGSLIFGIGSD